MLGRPTILVVKLSAIGDVILTTSAVKALRRHIPGARISWVVEPKSAGCLEGNPDIDEVILWRRDSLSHSLRTLGEIRRRKFDIALDFQGLARSAMVTLVSGAKRRIGYGDGREHSTFGYNELFHCPEMPHGMGCHLKMLSKVGVECDEEDGEMRLVATREELAKAEDVLGSLGVPAGEPIAAFVPATSRAFKHWKEQGWAEVADRLWHETGLRAVFLGAKADQPLIARIMSHVKSAPVVSAAGLTSLKISTVLVARSSLVVAVDTGLMHAAMAHGKNTVAIFANTRAWRNHIDSPNFRMVRKSYDCTLECVANSRKPSCENWDCITDVTAHEVMEAIRSFAPGALLEGSAR